MLVRRGGGGGEDPRSEGLHDRGESPEVRRYVLDVGSAVAQEPLRGAVEAAAIPHAGLGEHRVEVGEQCTEEVQVDPVVALAEGVQEGDGMGWAETDDDRIGRPHVLDGLRWGLDDGGHYCLLRSDRGRVCRGAALPGERPWER